MRLKTNPRQAHNTGITRVIYSLDGKFLFSGGANDLVRKFPADLSDEPDTLDHHHEAVVGMSCSDTQFASCSEDGTVHLFDIATNESKGVVIRNPLEIRDVKFSPDGNWLCACGDDKNIKIVNRRDILRLMEINLPTQVKHISYDIDGGTLASSGLDGILRFYRLEKEDNDDDGDDDDDEQNPFQDEPSAPFKSKLVYALDGVCPDIKDPADTRSTAVAWHPDNKHFAVATKTFEIALYSKDNWLEQKRLRHKDGHQNALTDLKWSPNGRYLATCGLDNKVIIWDSMTCLPIDSHVVDMPVSVAWHPTANEISVGNEKGQIITLEQAGEEHGSDVLLLDESFKELKHAKALDSKSTSEPSNGTRRDYDDYDLELGVFGGDDGKHNDDNDVQNELDWIEDDDGAGYIQSLEKREGDHDDARSKKRFKTSQPSISLPEPFISGSTPWKYEKRYLCLNTIGYIWAVNHDSYHTTTVTFFDRGVNKEYHFRDEDKYDLACLTKEASFFANSKTGKTLLRFHTGFTNNWEYNVAENDAIRSISASNSILSICTTNGYVRTFNIYGSPLSVYRQSRDPVVTCSAWKNYLFIVRTNSTGSLSYSIENVRTNVTYQKDDSVDIGAGNKLIAVFFTELGDPCIFDSKGILLVLVNWRDPLQTKWVPIIDSKAIAKSQGRQESYWPIGVIDNKFICTIIKGEGNHPVLPLPASTEFDISIPVDPPTSEYEQEYLTKKLLLELSRSQADSDDNLDPSIPVSSQELEVDKLLLRLIQASCIESKSSKALALCHLIHQDQALEAASKIALRFEQNTVAEKINQILSRRRRES